MPVQFGRVKAHRPHHSLLPHTQSDSHVCIVAWTPEQAICTCHSEAARLLGNHLSLLFQSHFGSLSSQQLRAQ